LGDLAKDKVIYEKCDTGDMQSVRDFAANVQKQFSEIHILINNGKTYFFIIILQLELKQFQKNVILILIYVYYSWCHVHAIPRD
jgi:NAD(P)-dependent dehydrogenase (short-subunit alcohol dehydrogenase family)